MLREKLEELLKQHGPDLDVTSYPDDVLVDAIEEIILGKQQVIDEQQNLLHYFRIENGLTERDMITLNENVNPL